MIQSKLLCRFLDIERQLFRTKDSRKLLNRIVKEAAALLDVDCVSIYSFNPERATMVWEATHGVNEKNIDVKETSLSLSKSAQKAYRTKKPVAVFDTKKEKAIPDILVKRFGFRSSLTVPLLGFGRNVLGFLFIDVIGKTRRFSPDELLLAEYLSNFASIAIEQARINTGLERTLDILSSYDEITALSEQRLGIGRFLKRMLMKLVKVLEMDGGAIQLYEGDVLVIKTTFGGTKKLARSFADIRVGKMTAEKVWKAKRPVIIEDAATDKRLPKPWRDVILESGYRSIFSLPMVVDDKVRGVLTVGSKQKKVYQKHEVDLFMNVGKQVGMMIENALLFEKIEVSRKKIKALERLNRSTVSILELPLLYRQVLDELPSIIPCYSSSILLADDDRRTLKVVSAYGPKRKKREGFKTRIGKGITGRVAKTGKPVNIPNIKKNRYYKEELPEVRSELCVPLVAKGKTIGVLNVEDYRMNAYTQDDLELLSAFGNEIAIAIENARLYQEAKERTAQLELINRVVKKIGLTLDIDSLSQKLCETIQGHFYYDYTLLFLLDEERENFVLKGHAGYAFKMIDYRQHIDKGLLGLCYKTKRSVLENDTVRNKRFIRRFPENVTIRSELDIPLVSGEKVHGVLSLQSRTKDAFSEWDLVAMETISEHIVSSLENARLYTYLRQSLAELSSVYEIGVSLSTSRDLNELLERMYRRTSVMTGARTFYVALYDKKSGTVQFAVDYEEGEKRQKEIFKANELGGYTGWILQNNAPILVKDLKVDAEKYPVKPIYDGLKMRSYLGVPIRFQDKVIGVLSLQSMMRNAFDESSLRLFTTFANQLGVVIENARLFTEMDVVLKRLEKSYDETLRSLVSALDFRERETQYHSIRVAVYAVELAKRIDIPEHDLKFIYWGGILHDIGKIGVPDEILLKPSELDDVEWRVIRRHPLIGYEIVKDINFLKDASVVILYHHEWWDGKGYPYGRKQDEIPLFARIFSVADALDSITSRRPYREAVSFKDAYKEIQRCSGTQFDPRIVSALTTFPLKFWERIKRSAPSKAKFDIPYLGDIYTPKS
jgi:putative nucleotidyltransferase with HDIG domain